MRDWFDDQELEDCPRCGDRMALQTPRGGFILCIECGIVGVRTTDDASAVELLPE
jgi:hypothetical protein